MFVKMKTKYDELRDKVNEPGDYYNDDGDVLLRPKETTSSIR